MVVRMVGQFNGGGMVMLQRLSVSWRENGHVTEVVSLKGEWSCYGGCHFNGGRKVIRGSSVLWRESGHVTVVVILKEGEWSGYRGCHFNGGKSSEGQRWSVNGGVMLWRWPV